MYTLSFVFWFCSTFDDVQSTIRYHCKAGGNGTAMAVPVFED